jgi:hypothetical protein
MSHSGAYRFQTKKNGGRFVLLTSHTILVFFFLAQSEEAQSRKQIATLDERLEALSQKLSSELTVIRTKWIPRVPPQAIQRMGIANGFSSRLSNTANLAARAIQRLPI